MTTRGPIRRPGRDRFRLAAAVLLAALSSLLGLSLLDPQAPWGRALARTSYDSYFSWFNLGANAPPDAPVLIAYLDLQSFRSRDLDQGQAWPRELHAQLVRRLKQAGAKAVVFDILFDRAGTNTAANQALRDAFAEHGRVILAGGLEAVSTDAGNAAYGRPLKIVPPIEPFRAVAAWGLGELAADEDFCVRRFYAHSGQGPDATPSLTLAAGKALGLATGDPADGEARWLNYYGPPFRLPHRSLDQLLRPGEVPDRELEGRVIFVGARPTVGQFTERRDEFRSPFRGWQERDRFMPGVEIHATQMLNLLRHEWLTQPPARSLAAWVLASGLLLGGLVFLRPLATTLVTLIAIGLVTATAIALFSNSLVWFPWLVIAAVQAPVAWAGSVAFRSTEWYLTWRRLEAERRAAETRIREQAALIEKAGDAILVEDLAGRMTYANPSARELLGDAARPGGPGLPPLTEVAEARREARHRGEWHGELRLASEPGRTLIIETRWTLLRDEQGRPSGLLIIGSDVTEKRQLEAETLRLQRTEAIGALAGGMAHDLNNALAPVLMGTQMLRREARDENAQRILSLMESSTRRGAEMVRQVLLFARGRDGEMTPLEIPPLLREMEKLARDTFPREIRVSVQVARDLWPVRGNATQLHQVLLNLCVNARDAMPGGGMLSLAADNVQLEAADCAGSPEARPGQFTVILVSDTGSGMSPEVRAKVFEPFFTTKPEGRGTGLGLSTTSRIIRAHGGFILLQSQPGEGTTFDIYLPRLTPTEHPSAAAPSAPPPRGRGQRILVADDDEAVREMLRRGLEDYGYRVVPAANGAEAVSAHKQFPDIAAFVTDRIMPVLDGLKAASVLRETNPQLPIVFLSGESDPEPADRPATGATTPPLLRTLTKPIDLEQLLAVMAELTVPAASASPPRPGQP